MQKAASTGGVGFTVLDNESSSVILRVECPGLIEGAGRRVHRAPAQKKNDPLQNCQSFSACRAPVSCVEASIWKGELSASVYERLPGDAEAFGSVAKTLGADAPSFPFPLLLPLSGAVHLRSLIPVDRRR